MAKRPIRHDYEGAREAALRADVKTVLANLLSAEVLRQSEADVQDIEDPRRMTHVYKLLDQLRGYEAPAMGAVHGLDAFLLSGDE